ncbi:phosphoribulokinase [Azospirillum halopraeferens]|uniref:phosphoribulokinase n=1 Tax=Azospirillum halopraeferens TaxID=34010 RepID=UPI000426716E|nr:phosphoribulokinase [Azospirillum halopraeferens]
MPANRVKDIVILGIVGDSASGKTTLASGIVKVLGEDRVAILCSDDYHRHSRRERAELGVSALDPRANHIDILEQHLKLLRQGQPILKPVYDHDTGDLVRPEYLAPKPYIIVEGLLGYTTRAMRDCYDVKVYLEPDEELRVRWKMARDIGRRGYTRDEVLASLERRRIDSPTYIHPQRTFADMVIGFHPPEEAPQESGVGLNVRHVLRPTLPHPDLTPIMESVQNGGIHLELCRDGDGKPVDVLEIAGGIASERARRLEDLLWRLLPEVRHLRCSIGEFTDTGNRTATSAPLAISQLLVAYHMVKAAMGVHAL